MSTILTITNDGFNKISIYAPDTRTFISDSKYKNWIFDITGDAEKPFISACYFERCTIIADDLRAFSNCYFDDSCEMLVKNLPVALRAGDSVSINENRVSRKVS